MAESRFGDDPNQENSRTTQLYLLTEDELKNMLTNNTNAEKEKDLAKFAKSFSAMMLLVSIFFNSSSVASIVELL